MADNYVAFLILQSLLPVCALLEFLTGREFVLHSEGLFLLALSGVTVWLTVLIRRGGESKGAAPSLLLSIGNALTMLLTLPGLGTGVAAIVMILCGWLVFERMPDGAGKRISQVISLLLSLGLLLIMPIWMFAAVMGYTETVLALDSPDGNYTAIVTNVDQGALGGDTLVEIRNNGKTVNVDIGSFVSTCPVYRGPWGQWQDLDLLWQDENTLLINGKPYDARAEELAFWEQLRFLSNLSKNLGAELDGGKVTYYCDSHGGFHGDGITEVQISASLQAPDSEYWHSLPLSENAARGLTHFGFEIPEVENGYWFFCDRHSQSTDPADDSGLFSRHSYNFTLAVYDPAAGMLYYFEFDT